MLTVINGPVGSLMNFVLHVGSGGLVQVLFSIDLQPYVRELSHSEPRKPHFVFILSRLHVLIARASSETKQHCLPRQKLDSPNDGKQFIISGPFATTDGTTKNVKHSLGQAAQSHRKHSAGAFLPSSMLALFQLLWHCLPRARRCGAVSTGTWQSRPTVGQRWERGQPGEHP